MTSTNAPSRLYIPQPFAEGSTDHVDVEATSSENLNFVHGFPDAYSASTNENGGKFVTRKEINALGYLATVNEYQKACGGIVTFDPALATNISGYPKDAILEWVKDSEYYRVISLVDDNMVDFRSETDTSVYTKITNGSIDNVYWAYATEKTSEVPDAVELCDVDTGEIGDDDTGGTSILFQVCTARIARTGVVSASVKLGTKTIITGGSAQLTMYMSYKMPNDTAFSDQKILWAYGTSTTAIAEPVALPTGTLISVKLLVDDVQYDNINIKVNLV